MLKDLINVIYDKTFKIIILKEKVNIINYDDILVFEDEKILVKSKETIIKITGNDLTINKLYNNELLIEGKMNNIEFR